MDPVSITEAARRLGVSREEIRSRIRKGELESRQMSTATGVGMGVVLPDDGSRPTGGQPLQPTPPPPQAGGGITTPPMQGWTGQAPAATPPLRPPAAPPIQEPMTETPQAETPPTLTPPPPAPAPTEAPPIGEMVQPPRVEPPQRQGLLLEPDLEPPAPPPKPPRSSPLRELVGVLQHQVEVQREELEARRREVQELHVLLQQLQSRALPAPPEDTSEPQASHRTTTPSEESPQPEAPEKMHRAPDGLLAGQKPVYFDPTS